MATNTHVLDAFIPFGEIVEVQVPKNDKPNSMEPHKGFAYVEYEDAADAKEAIDNMDQAEFFGKVLRVSQAKAPKSADEGLGSKTAVWEQVRLSLLPGFTIRFADRFGNRRDGLQSKPKRRRRLASMVSKVWEPLQNQPQIRCKD